MSHRKYMTAIIWGLTVSLLTSCNGGGSAGDTPAVVPEPIVVVPEPTKEEQLAKLEAELITVDAEIKAMIGQAQCASSLDCRLLGLIPKGDCSYGYGFYAAYSVRETKQEHLSAVYGQKQKLESRLLEIMCSATLPLDQQPIECFINDILYCPAVIPAFVPPPPSASCINNQCRGIDSPRFVGGGDAGIIREQINAMIDYPVCGSSEQCGVWSVGYSLKGDVMAASPSLCGADTTFAYSTFVTDPTQMAEKVGQYAQSVAAAYNAQGLNAVCQSSVSFANGVCRNERCEAN